MRGLTPVVAVGVAYALGLMRMWARVGRGRLVSETRVALFAFGLAATAVALGPPLDGVVTHNLTAHMTQHVLLLWVAAPLLVAGAPLPVLLWTLSDERRVRVQHRWQHVHRIATGNAWPVWVVVAMLVQSVVLLGWHAPALYQSALHNDLVHAVEHASFLLSAMAFWWLIAGAVRQSRYGTGVLAVFGAKLPCLLLGVGMTIDPHVWFRAYGTSAAGLQDQQWAGVVMWMGGGTVATIGALVLLGLWLRALERAAPAHIPERIPEHTP